MANPEPQPPWAELPTPCNLLDLGRLERNLEILDGVARRSGARILLALKAFATFPVFPRLARVLHGVCASSIDEARLGREEFGKEVHAYAPAYSREDAAELAGLADTVVFNSLRQWRELAPLLDRGGRSVERGLRLNPEYSEVRYPLYNPCVPGSRLGLRAAELAGQDLEGLSGFHFHALCEQGADVLDRVAAAAEAKFGALFARASWLNLGGGQLVTQPGFDLARLEAVIGRFQERYRARIYLEPGEAVVLDAGMLVASVLDVVHNDRDLAILDLSAAAHLPDVLEMPYRPRVLGAGEPGASPHTWRLAGNTCLAGDVIGDYSFARPLAPGDRVVFQDMAHYTSVKATTFNGVRLPSLATWDPEKKKVEILRRFGYADFKSRLG